jgi:hypothetical protein
MLYESVEIDPASEKYAIEDCDVLTEEEISNAIKALEHDLFS